MQAPAYHMHIKDLVLAQKVEYFRVARTDPEKILELYHKHQRDLATLRQQHRDERARTNARKAFVAALRQHHRDERARTNARKAFLAPRKLEPDFWTYYPNHDGRRDTMEAVLKVLGFPKEQATELMQTYATWLLTVNKMHANGRPMNRWALMTAFVVEALRAPTPPSQGEELAHEVEALRAPTPPSQGEELAHEVEALVKAHPSLLE